MKMILILSAVFCLAACKEDDSPSGARLRDNAMLYSNGLAFDGCETHVALNWNDPQKRVSYALDAKSIAQTEWFLGKESRKEGNITYKFTGRKGVVQCGWGKKFEADEITIISIR